MVATRDLGGLGPSETEPVLLEWRWYYHVPGLAIWVLVAALLVLVKDNRSRRAWTILMPAILLTTVVWPLIVRLTGRTWVALFCFTRDEQADFAFNSLVAGWVALWLTAPWLARRRASVAFLLALAFLLLSGIVAHVCAFSGGPLYPSPATQWYKQQLNAILWYSTCAAAMLLGMTLGAVACRNAFRWRRFLFGVALGILAGAFVGTATYACLLYPSLRAHNMPVLFQVLNAVVQWLGVATFTYLVNLPFLYLAYRCPCYRDRLQNVLRLPDHNGAS